MMKHFGENKRSFYNEFSTVQSADNEVNKLINAGIKNQPLIKTILALQKISLVLEIERF